VRRRVGFTLVELVAVVTLLALLAGAVAVSLTGEADRARRVDVIGQLRHADRTARLAAQREGEAMALRFDLSAQRVWRRRDNGERDGPVSHPFHLPGAFRIARVVKLETPAEPGYPRREPDVERIDRGTATIAYSANGRSVSYALRVAHRDEPRDAASNGAAGIGPWLVVSGLTGQVTVHDDAETIDKLFAVLADGGADAD